MAGAVYSCMRTARCLFALLLCGSACAVDDDAPGPTDTVSPDEAPTDKFIDSHVAASPTEEASICDVLPPDGPCSLACDERALAEQYVPEGACAAFLCTLTDGREVAVHACHVEH